MSQFIKNIPAIRMRMLGMIAIHEIFFFWGEIAALRGAPQARQMLFEPVFSVLQMGQRN